MGAPPRSRPPDRPLTSRLLLAVNAAAVIAWTVPPGFLAKAATLATAWAAAWWAADLRGRRSDQPQPGPGWTFIPALATTPPLIGFVGWPNSAELAAAACVIGLASGTTTAWTGRGRPATVAAAGATLSLLGMSVWLWAAMETDAARGLFWSELPRLALPWVPYGRRPLTKTAQPLQAARVSVLVSIVCAAACVLPRPLWWAISRARRVRA